MMSEQRLRELAAELKLPLDEDVEVAVGGFVDDVKVVVGPDDEAAAVAETAEKTPGEEMLVKAKIATGMTVTDLQKDDHEF